MLVSCVLTGCKREESILSELVQEKVKEYDLTVSSISTSTVKFQGADIHHYDAYCVGFKTISNEEMPKIARRLWSVNTKKATYFLESLILDGDRYTFNTDYDEITKNGEKIYSGKPDSNSSKSKKSSDSTSSAKNKRKCPLCKGTGIIEYYATNDPWEEPELAECTMCHGKGTVTD